MSFAIPPHNTIIHPAHLGDGQAHILPLYINGHWQAGHGNAFTSHNPATGEAVWEGASASRQDVDLAVKAAQKAFPAWAKLSFTDRQKIAERFRDLLEANKDKLASLIAQETGKVLWDAKSEMAAMIGKIAISIKAYEERTPTRESKAADGSLSVLRHRPHGVVGVFGPYNFPAHLPNGHIVPALLAGNCVVFKPSEHTPAVAEAMVKLWQEAGLPAGVLNLVQGKRDTGEALAAHAELDGIFFTGSPAVGKILHERYASQPHKILALEMGGNNPLIIWDAKDAEAAAYLTIQSAFISSGQRCTCARRLIIPEGKKGRELLDAIIKMTSNIRVGKYDDTPEPFMGPLISLTESERLMAAQEKLAENGAKTLLAMRRLEDDTPLLTPGIIDVTDVKDRTDEEFFGPLLQVIRVPDFDAAIKEANNTRFGLAAGLISDSRKLYEDFILHIRAGVVNWNRATTGASSAMPFGGVGLSGNHRPSAYYAADYCAYPMASMESEKLTLPATLSPGITKT